MDGAVIDQAREWILRESADAPHSAVIVRYGRLVAEWYKDTTAEIQDPMASASRSPTGASVRLMIGWWIIIPK